MSSQIQPADIFNNVHLRLRLPASKDDGRPTLSQIRGKRGRGGLEGKGSENWERHCSCNYY